MNIKYAVDSGQYST